MPQSDTMGVLFLDGNSFTGERTHILAGFMYLCPCLWLLSTKDCSITFDELSQFKSSSTNTGLCSKLRSWHISNNQIDDRGARAVMNHLPSLFPCLGYNEYDDVDLCNNLVSSEVKKRLEEKLRERREVSCCDFLLHYNFADWYIQRIHYNYSCRALFTVCY